MPARVQTVSFPGQVKSSERPFQDQPSLKMMPVDSQGYEEFLLLDFADRCPASSHSGGQCGLCADERRKSKQFSFFFLEGVNNEHTLLNKGSMSWVLPAPPTAGAGLSERLIRIWR